MAKPHGTVVGQHLPPRPADAALSSEAPPNACCHSPIPLSPYSKIDANRCAAFNLQMFL